MPSAKSIYKKWLIVCVVLAVIGTGVLLIWRNIFFGIVLIAISLCFMIYGLFRLGRIRYIEKHGKRYKAKFVSSDHEWGLKNPMFSITVEIDLGDKIIIAKTACIYSAWHISGIVSGSEIYVGYSNKYKEVIVLD